MKLITILSLLLFGTTGLFADKEIVASWASLYEDTKDLDQKYSVINKLVELHDKDAALFLRGALQSLYEKKIDAGTGTEKFQKIRLAKAIIVELGNLQDIDSAETIFSIYRDQTDPFLKGEAAIALGKMRATSFAENLAKDLSSQNLLPPEADRRNSEILATALIQALTVMRAEIGYEPVFIAATAWYSGASGVKTLAKNSLPSIIDDPTNLLLKILTVNKKFDVKLLVIEAEMSSKANSQNKAIIAIQSLREGLENEVTDATDKLLVRKLRLAAIDALNKLGDKTPKVVDFLSTIISLDTVDEVSLDETLKCYVLLGINGTDGALKLLSDKLKFYNERQKSSANSPRDKIIILQVLDSVLLTKSKLLKLIVDQTALSGHDNNIRRKAESVSESLSK